jgi:hypothetical protein
MNELAGEPHRTFVIRILEKWLVMLVFVLCQKPYSYFRNCSLRHNFDGMAVGVTHEKCLAKIEHLHVIRDSAGRYKLHSCCDELGCRCTCIRQAAGANETNRVKANNGTEIP